jgi:GntR family transcriptional repressor for pyruvate dehydrogenase complex
VAAGVTEPGSPSHDDAWTGSLLEPLPMRTAGERIADRLLTSVALGHFVVGQRLPSERELAARLEVSRASVREAIQRLTALGHLTVRRGNGGGAFVQATAGVGAEQAVRRTLVPQWDRLEHLLDLRRLVERQTAQTAAERRTRADISAINRALHDYQRAGDDRESSRQADLALHTAIAAAAGNPLLVDLSLRIRHEVSLGSDAEPYSPRARRRALVQHPALVQAVVDGDPTTAAALADEHFSLTEEMLRDLLRDVGAGSRRRPAPTRQPSTRQQTTRQQTTRQQKRT